MKKLIVAAVLLMAFNAVFAQPSGSIIAYAGTKESLENMERQGWLVCDGRLVDRTNQRFQNLFSAIGTSWGGDGGNKFALPDLRGMFLRGISENSGNDPDATNRGKARPDLNASGNGGNAVGSMQNDALTEHTHTYPYGSWHNNGEKGDGIGYVGVNQAQTWNTRGVVEEKIKSTETRPKNVYVYYIIKL